MKVKWLKKTSAVKQRICLTSLRALLVATYELNQFRWISLFEQADQNMQTLVRGLAACLGNDRF